MALDAVLARAGIGSADPLIRPRIARDRGPQSAPVRLRAARIALIATLVACSPVPGMAQLPFPGVLPGVDVAGNLPPGFEASGLAWHMRLHRLFVVDDGGLLACLDSDGDVVQTWSLGGDLEAVCVADPESAFVYLGLEHPDRILEFNIESGLVARHFDLTSILTGPPDRGLEALTFARDPAHPEGGLFYAGLQNDGRIYQLELPISSSTIQTSVKHLSTLTPAPSTDDISGLDWVAETDTLYASYESADAILALDSTGLVSSSWWLPGDNQEGLAIRGCRLFVAQDSGEVLRYQDFPGPASCDEIRIDVASISLSTGGTQHIDIAFGPEQAGTLYIVLGTLTDTLPGFTADGVHVPLQVDAYFFYTVGNPNSAVLGLSLGLLDANAKSTSTFTVPVNSNPALAGTNLYHAVVLLGATVLAASNPAPVGFAP